MNIQFLDRKEIDTEKWNACVVQSKNTLPYAYTWYLDATALSWSALILNDYEAVMPLCHARNMGFQYAYQPFFNQQGGVFGKEKVLAKTVAFFIAAIPTKYRYVELNLNYGNSTGSIKDFEITERTNLILPLNKNYEAIHKAFSENTKRNIKKAEKNNLVISNKISATAFGDFYEKNNADKIEKLSSTTIKNLKKLISNAVAEKSGILLGVYQNERLVAANFFVKSTHRIINLLPASNEKGKELQAMSYLLNHIIKQHSDSNLVFDFEGSMIEGVARFYQGFGAVNQNFTTIKRNNLPAFVKLFKS